MMLAGQNAMLTKICALEIEARPSFGSYREHASRDQWSTAWTAEHKREKKRVVLANTGEITASPRMHEGFLPRTKCQHDSKT